MVEEETRKKQLKEINEWNESSFMSDCLGCHWKELIKIIKGKK